MNICIYQLPSSSPLTSIIVGIEGIKENTKKKKKEGEKKEREKNDIEKKKIHKPHAENKRKEENAVESRNQDTNPQFIFKNVREHKRQ